MTEADEDALCDYAMGVWLVALIDEARWHGRGWYHFAGGRVIVGVRLTLEKENEDEETTDSGRPYPYNARE